MNSDSEMILIMFSDDSHDTGPDEPDSPTVLLDKKTRRRFLDLGLVS